MIQLAPSLLSADFLHLAESVEFVNKYGDMFHLDIMDGVMVPNLSYGFPVVQAVSSIAEKPLDVHLMIVHPEKYVSRFAEAGASMISFHLEAADRDGLDPLAIIELIRSHGAKAGIAINPDVPPERIFPYLDKMDFVLVMSVFAGFGGQKFIEDTFGRVRAVKDEIDRIGSSCIIEVDGGVSPSNARALADAGASIIVAGNSVFNAPDPAAAVAAIKA